MAEVTLTELEHRLSPDDARRARVAALARVGQNMVTGRAPAYGAKRSIGLDIDGTRAELAFARMLGVPLDQWAAYTSGALDAIRSDVAGWQVRSTRHRHGHLIIHPRDDRAARFALIVTNGVVYRAAGWIVAGDAHRPEWWQQLNAAQAAAWCVPQADLRPFG